MSQAGDVDVTSTHPEIATQFDADTGFAVPIANVLNIIGDGFITTDGSGNTITINSPSSISGVIRGPDVNFLAIGNTPIYSFTADFVVTGFVVVNTSLTGTVNVDGAYNLGWTGPNYDNMISGAGGSAFPTGLTNEAGFFLPAVVNDFPIIPAGQTLTIRITVPDSGPSVFVNRVDVVGYYFAGVAPNPPILPITYTANNSGTATPTLGNVNIFGATVAAGTTPVSTIASSSTLTTNVQISQAIAAADATKIGLANFDSDSFSVDSTGFVTYIGASTKITTFTNDGSWTIDPRSVKVDIFAYGGGGGGGGGRAGASGTAGGGAGGSGGFSVVAPFEATSLTGSPYTVTIGTGGTGGASVNGVLADGNNGNPGTVSSVGSAVIAAGGNGGTGGRTTNTTAQSVGFSVLGLGINGTTEFAGCAGRGAVAGPGTITPAPSGYYASSTGGGGGSGWTSAAVRTGTAGGDILSGSGVLVAGGLAGNNAGATAGNGNSPGAGVPFTVGGTGGGSGGNDGGAVTPVAGAGGNGGFPSGGGGGGSGTLSGNASGAGGDGANGRIIIVEYF